MEAHNGLDVDQDAHIWLLQHLFLPSINADAEAWAATWNHHSLARRGQTHRSPHEMYLHGLIEHGTRGIFVEPDVDDGEYDDYGIDWDDLDDHHIRRHHDAFNPDDGDPENPFVSNRPDHLSHVDVADPRCPFTAEQVQILDDHLRTLPFINDHDMNAR